MSTDSEPRMIIDCIEIPTTAEQAPAQPQGTVDNTIVIDGDTDSHCHPDKGKGRARAAASTGSLTPRSHVDHRRRSKLHTASVPGSTTASPTKEDHGKVVDAIKGRLHRVKLRSSACPTIIPVDAAADAVAVTADDFMDIDVDDFVQTPFAVSAGLACMGQADATAGDTAAGPSGSRAFIDAASDLDSLFDPNLGLDYDMSGDEAQVAADLGAQVNVEHGIDVDVKVEHDVNARVAHDTAINTTMRVISRDGDSVGSGRSRSSSCAAAMRAAPAIVAISQAASQRVPAQATQEVVEEKEEICCGCCYIDVEEIKQEAVEAGKGGEGGKLSIYSCGQRACQTVFCMSCILEYCNRKIDMRQTVPSCPACTRPLDLDILREQARAYDPSIAQPLHEPPAPPYEAYLPWVQRYIQAAVVRPVDKSAIADYIAYFTLHGIASPLLLRHQVYQEWHIACCVAAWADYFGLQHAEVVNMLNKLDHIQGRDNYISAQRIERALALPDLYANPPAVRDAAPFIPALPRVAEARAFDIPDAEVALATRYLGRMGRRNDAVLALHDIAFATHEAGLEGYQQMIVAFLGIMNSGKATVGRVICKQNDDLRRVLYELMHHPDLVRARGNISVAPIIAYFGSTTTDWLSSYAKRQMAQVPASGPLHQIFKALVSALPSRPRRILNAQPHALVHLADTSARDVAEATAAVQRRNDLAQQVYELDAQLVRLGAGYTEQYGLVWMLGDEQALQAALRQREVQGRGIGDNADAQGGQGRGGIVVARVGVVDVLGVGLNPDYRQGHAALARDAILPPIARMPAPPAAPAAAQREQGRAGINRPGNPAPEQQQQRQHRRQQQQQQPHRERRVRIADGGQIANPGAVQIGPGARPPLLHDRAFGRILPDVYRHLPEHLAAMAIAHDYAQHLAQGQHQPGHAQQPALPGVRDGVARFLQRHGYARDGGLAENLLQAHRQMRQPVQNAAGGLRAVRSADNQQRPGGQEGRRNAGRGAQDRA